MSKRVFLIAFSGGLLSSATACYPLYRWLPAQFVDNWSAANRSIAIFWLVLTAAIWFLTGAAAARWGGSNRRRVAAGHGALAGLLAAWLVEVLLGGAALGIWGARLLLAHGVHPARDETEFLFLIAHSTLSILWGVNLSIWPVGGMGALIGALGGWLAGPGHTVSIEEPPSHWLMVCALVIPWAALSLIISAAIFTSLSSGLEHVSAQLGIPLPYSIEGTFTLITATPFIWLLFWQVLAWRWTRKALPAATARLLLGVFLSLVIFLLLSVLTPLGLLITQEAARNETKAALLRSIILTIFAIFAYWAAPKVRLPTIPLPAFLKAWGSRLAAFLRRQGEAQLAAWYFLVLNVTAFIVMTSIFPRIWMLVGLTIGVVLGGLGVWETRRIARSSEANVARIAFNRSQWFVLGILSGFINTLWMSLDTLAASALIALPIRMIVPLIAWQRTSEAVTAPFTLPDLIRTAYRLPPLVFLVLLWLSIVYALLFSAAMTILNADKAK